MHRETFLSTRASSSGAPISRLQVNPSKESHTTEVDATIDKASVQWRFDLDNLRVLLATLVIFHHTAMSLGAAGPWSYKSRYIPTGGFSIPLILLTAFDYSFIMGVFLAISGYASAQSLANADRSDTPSCRWLFVKKKVMRLGVPAMLFTLIIQPLALSNGNLGTWVSFGDYLANTRRVTGVSWYLGTLLAFDILAAIVTPRWTAKNAGKNSYPNFSTLAKWGWVVAGLSSVLIRNHWGFWYRTPIIGVQMSYLPHFVFGYVLGYVYYAACSKASQGNPTLVRVRIPDVKVWQAVAISMPLMMVCYIPGMVNPKLMHALVVGWGPLTFGFALWNEFSFLLMAAALFTYARKHWSAPTKSALFRPRYSYAAYLVHPLVTVLIGHGVDHILDSAAPQLLESKHLPVYTLVPVALTCVVGSINTLLSFALARLLCGVPAISSIV